MSRLRCVIFGPVLDPLPYSSKSMSRQVLCVTLELLHFMRTELSKTIKYNTIELTFHFLGTIPRVKTEDK